MAAVFLKANKKSPNLVGVELDEDRIKIIVARLSSLKREVIFTATREIRGMSDEDVATYIRQALEPLKLRDARVMMAAPLYQLITRSIEIPSTDPKEIQEIVNLQANRHTPYSRSEIIVDMLVIGLVRENYTKVLLVIGPKELVNRQTKIVERLNLKIETIFFPPEGIALATAKIIGEGSLDSATAVVHVDATFTTFFISQKGKILFVRGIPIGSNQLIDEREITRDRYVDELQKSLESYTGDEMGPPPKGALVMGAVDEIGDLDEMLMESLNVPVRRQTYYQYFSAADSAQAAMAASKRASFFGVIASVLLFDKLKVDLTSEERKLQRKLEGRGRQMMTTGILVMILLSLFFSLFVIKFIVKKTYLQNLVARYKPLREDAKKVEQQFSRNQGIKDFLTSRGSALESLAELYEVTPAQVKVSGIKLEETGKFTIRGTALMKSIVFDYVASLEKSDVFKNVKTKFVTSRIENGQNVSDFEINCIVDRKGFLSLT